MYDIVTAVRAYRECPSGHSASVICTFVRDRLSADRTSKREGLKVRHEGEEKYRILTCALVNFCARPRGPGSSPAVQLRPSYLHLVGGCSSSDFNQRCIRRRSRCSGKVVHMPMRYMTETVARSRAYPLLPYEDLRALPQFCRLHPSARHDIPSIVLLVCAGSIEARHGAMD